MHKKKHFQKHYNKNFISRNIAYNRQFKLIYLHTLGFLIPYIIIKVDILSSIYSDCRVDSFVLWLAVSERQVPIFQHVLKKTRILLLIYILIIMIATQVYEDLIMFVKTSKNK